MLKFEPTKKQILTWFIIVSLLFMGYFHQKIWHRETVKTVSVETIAASDTTYESTEKICVHVSGEVQHPGLYMLDAFSRVDDALQQAGITEQSDIEVLNRAAFLQDGQKIVVPTKGEFGTENSTEPIYRDGKIHLNTATLEELQTLPGIGLHKAEAILAYRQEQGGFSDVKDIQNVSGIGEAIYQKIENKIAL